MLFYVGVHQPSMSAHVTRAFISINRVRTRRAPVPSADWILDSGAFREIEHFGRYRDEPAAYARDIERIAAANPGLRAAVAQDFMCENFILARTGLSIAEHQRLTIDRYVALVQLVHAVPVMPVLQGYAPADYVQHLRQYGDRLAAGAHVGVVLRSIKQVRPDLRLHGFGLKTTALGSAIVRDSLHSADSMAWSFAARYEGRGRNDPAEAAKFARKIETMPVQEAWKF
jgi:hypothetical protein